MKFDIDIMYAFVLCMLIILFTLQARDVRSLQVQLEELKIIVDQKFLPALILEDISIRE